MGRIKMMRMKAHKGLFGYHSWTKLVKETNIYYEWYRKSSWKIIGEFEIDE